MIAILKCTRVQHGLTGHCNTDLNIVDEKGRKVGVYVHQRIVEFVPFTEGDEGVRAYYRHEPGLFFATRVQASRNGSDFGAIQGEHFFASEAARSAHEAKAIANARARYLKKYGRQDSGKRA